MRQRGKRHADTQVILALACGASVERAAQQSGVSERTIYRRLDDPEFHKKVDDTRAEMVKRTMSMLIAAGMESVKTLLDLQKPATGAATRLGSARAVLELGTKLREMVTFEERLAALEEHMTDGKPRQPLRKR